MDKRILMIARGYYPSNGPGAHRPAQLAKYLPRYGWTPVVICADLKPDNCPGDYDPGLASMPDGCEIFRIPYAVPAVRSLGHYLQRVALILWPYKTPRKFYRDMLTAADEVISKEPFDVIWSTFSPGLTHTIAEKMSRKYGIPWVADFRDLPDQTYNTWQTRHWVKSEIKVCRSASTLITTTELQAERLALRYSAPVHTITNGFDPDDYPPVSIEPSETFNIRFFGTFYEYRNPQPLFAALDQLAERQEVDWNEIRVEFYGTHPKDLAARVHGYKCERIVELKKRLTRDEVIPMQQQASVLLLLKSPESGGAIPAKIFDYLGAQRPILNIPGDGNLVDDILRKTKAGVSVGEPDEVANRILEWYRQWKAIGYPKYQGIPERIAEYSREVQARQLAEILESVCRK